MPFDFIDRTSLIGPVERVRDRLAAYAEAGVTTLSVASYARTLDERVGAMRTLADAPRRIRPRRLRDGLRALVVRGCRPGRRPGLTEFLPISSSAHLRVVAELAGWEDPGAAFTAVTQLGTETAVLVYFRHDIVRIVTMWARSLWRPELRGRPDARMGWYVIVGTLPIGILGFLFRDLIEGRHATCGWSPRCSSSSASSSV